MTGDIVKRIGNAAGNLANEAIEGLADGYEEVADLGKAAYDAATAGVNRVTQANTGDILQRLGMYIVSQAVSIPFVKKPFQDLENPARYDLENASNIRIKIEDEDSEEEIGCWFLQPLTSKLKDDEQAEKNQRNDTLIKENEKVILYLHGNGDKSSVSQKRAVQNLSEDGLLCSSNRLPGLWRFFKINSASNNNGQRR